MKPTGRQAKIESGEYHYGFQKLIEGGGAKSKYRGDRNTRSGTRGADEGRVEHKWQGSVRGRTTHKKG